MEKLDPNFADFLKSLNAHRVEYLNRRSEFDLPYHCPCHCEGGLATAAIQLDPVNR